MALTTPFAPRVTFYPTRKRRIFLRQWRLLNCAGLAVPMISTEITGIQSPQAEAIVKTASQLGIARTIGGEESPIRRSGALQQGSTN